MKKIFNFLRVLYQKADIRKPDSWLGTLVSLLLRLGTLFLIITVVFLVIRIFREEGYSIETFLVPENLTKNGFDGNVMARQLQDEYSVIRAGATSIKSENFQTVSGNEQAELNISVMGVGISLRNIAFQLRELLGRKNHVIRCEITQADSTLGVTLRMTDYPTVTILSPKKLGERASLLYLHRKICEQILKYTDPYRLSLYYLRNGKYAEAMDVARNMLIDKPIERQWATIAMGYIYEETGQIQLALKKYDEAINFDPKFALAYMRHAWLNQRNGLDSHALPYIEKALQVVPNEASYLSTYGISLNNLKRYKESDFAFENMIKYANDDMSYQENWADAKASRGDIIGAKAIYESALKSDITINQRLQCELQLAQLNQDTALYVQKSLQLLDYEPNNIDIIDGTIDYFWKTGKYREIVDLGVKLHYNSEDRSRVLNYYNFRAMAFNLLGNRDSAMANVQRAIDITPTNPFPQSTLAEIYAMNGDIEGFYKALEKAFLMGFNPASLVPTDIPYNRFVGKKQYEDLLKKYRK
jgi:tetratricopeptide (TPR) repeat protein